MELCFYNGGIFCSFALCFRVDWHGELSSSVPGYDRHVLFHKTQMATYGKESRMYMIKANAQVTIAYGLLRR